jgi:ABC-2 type transport system ATP-binding protein
LPFIECTEVTKTFRQGFWQKKSKPALQDLSFAVRRGEVFGIVGPNGAGKSTTIKILMGFVRPDSGQVVVDGRDATDPRSHQQVGYLPENPSLYKNLCVVDHLRFAARLAGLSATKTRERTERVLAAVDLSGSARLPIRRFSKGMTQRAALAYALLLEPQILILDEPMSGLDPLGRQLVVDLIRDYHARGNTILFCSHVLSDVERICTRIGIMHQGRLATITTPEELRALPLEPGQSKTPLETLFLRTVGGGQP